MSTGYTYTDRGGRPMGIDTLLNGEIWLAVPKGNLFIRKADAPTVALELLKAAGHADLAGYIVSVNAAREAAEKAEAEAAEKKLQDRRDALAKEFTKGICYYESVVRDTKTAIDRIIELEDKLDGASRD